MFTTFFLINLQDNEIAFFMEEIYLFPITLPLAEVHYVKNVCKKGLHCKQFLHAIKHLMFCIMLS